MKRSLLFPREVALCIAAYEQLTLEGVKTRVVSMPSWDLLERQDVAYREQVLPYAVTARVCVEAASAQACAQSLAAAVPEPTKESK